MTKKEYCLKNPPMAYYNGVNGVEICGIEYGFTDYIYCISGAWRGKKRYHKLKIQHNKNGEAFFRIHNYRIPLNECIRMEV